MQKFVLSVCIWTIMLAVAPDIAYAQSSEGKPDTPDAQHTPNPGEVTPETDETVPTFEGRMTPERIGEIILKIDENAEVGTNNYTFALAERQLFLIYDTNADRIRIISPIFPVGNLPEGVEARLLQANFDAVLDARYAIAQDLVWAVFLHRLSSLQEEDFLSGIAQVVTAAETFGTTYTSGAVVYGGGDSNTIHEDLLDKLKELQKSADGEEDI